MSKELFEVFLGTFNAEPWIEQIINSLEAQDCPAFRVKIIDNASTDDTVAILKNLLANNIFKNEYTLLSNDSNIGAISSFLDRLDEFDSEWIVMVHQDDNYHVDHIGTLISALMEASASTGIVFTAMQRINGEGDVKFSPPTLSSKLSKTDRLENFMLSLQISPVNFPACALKKSELLKTNTSRHTTAFNDTEMLLRMMCISDVVYVPRETMHYRVYPGNAASITSSLANDRAIFVGLVELFHSDEVDKVLTLVHSPDLFEKLIQSINQAIDIRIQSTEIQNLVSNMIAETLIRRYGYQNKEITQFLIESLTNLGLTRELEMAKNLLSNSKFQRIEYSRSTEVSYFVPNISQLGKSSVANKLVQLISLPTRESFFDFLLRSWLVNKVSRPFVRVWRLRGK